MKAENIKLVDFLSSSKTIFRIPIYQRNYEWGRDQCMTLFHDLENASLSHKEHFLGTLVYVPENGENMSYIYVVIDGQQRLTSFMLLLKALADSSNQIKDEITESFLINKYISTNNHVKLEPVDKDQDAFQAIMDGDEASYKEPSKVIENYRYFKRLIANSNLSSSELYQATKFMTSVYIALDSGSEGENPQVVFESLNSTGVALSAPDLIRNFILMQLDDKDQVYLYRKYWSKINNLFTSQNFTEFMRQYLMMVNKRSVKEENVYATYKRYYIQHEFTAEQALKQMYLMAKYYHSLMTGTGMSPKMNRIMTHINILNKKSFYPYFLKLMNMKAFNSLSWSDIEEIGLLIESYLFRRIICGIPANLNNIVINLIKYNSFNSDDEFKTEYSYLKAYLLGNKFPDDREFKKHLAIFPIYKRRKDLAKLTLMIVEEHLTKETIDFNDAQVEHIMPQHLSATWKIQMPNADDTNRQYGDTLGNLTLTKYNQEISNRSYYEKKTFYNESNVYITREIPKDYPSWNKKSILDRSEDLANGLIGIFKRPELTYDEKNSDIIGEHSITEEVDVTGHKPVRWTINGKDYPVTSWSKSLVLILNILWDMDSENFDAIKKDQDLNKRIFVNLRHPKILNNGEKVSSLFSASVILALISKMVSLCGIEKDVDYTIK